MKLEQAIAVDEDAKLVRRYGDGYVVVNDESVETSCILTPRELYADWAPDGFEALGSDHIERLVAFDPDMILLGTGRTQRFPHPTVMTPAFDKRVGVEVMDTGAACRTFNILMNEGRQVVAGLLMIDGGAE